MDVNRVAIIGTNSITVAIALVLKEYKEPPEIVGYDAKTIAADLARARGAFDRVVRKPDQACQDADLIIIAVPLPDVQETFTTIAPVLKSGALVIDTTRLKAPVLRWAERLLPEGVFFVGGHVILNPGVVGLESPEELEDVDAALLTEALFCFVTPPETPDAVISACAGLANMLDVNPLFMDATEHDGLQAGIEGLPDLLAIALLRATVDTPGWEEMRKFAGRRFAMSTEVTDDIFESYFAIFQNREPILRRLDVLLHKLHYLRDLLTQEKAEMLEQAFVTAAEGRELWIEERNRGMWIEGRAAGSTEMPGMGTQIRRMFLGDRSNRREEDSRRSRGKR